MIRYFILFVVFSFSLSWVLYTIEPVTEAELGERLFFDPILSLDSTISCASCHKVNFAFADDKALSPGINGTIGKRNAPSIMNTAGRSVLFYDGRAKSLTDQVHFPIEDPLEMNHTLDIIIKKLTEHKDYHRWFKNIYKEKPSAENLAKAIAAFEVSLETSDSEFDAWMNDEPNTMSVSAIRGRTIFLSDRAKCFDCHFGPDFTGDDFRNIGLYDGKSYIDKGRYEITKRDDDLGKFKVPGLRNVSVTAPYMHDGSFRTLSEVIEYYSDPYAFVEKPINIDSTLRYPILFTDEEKKDLEAFLISLTDRRFTSAQNKFK
ncbi:MAG: cytochrome-c peroxidase [Saprospiraceae bacterium]|nr:cytochrome-c peroxidase [Saprospiraceae bacterium]